MELVFIDTPSHGYLKVSVSQLSDLGLSNKDFSFIKKVVIQYTPALRTYIDQIDDDSLDPVIASQVNNVLVNPFKKNASFVYKTLIILIWVLAFVSPFIAAYFFNYYSLL